MKSFHTCPIAATVLTFAALQTHAVARPPEPPTATLPPLSPIADDPRLQGTDGQQRAYWPPSVPFDHRHMRLELTIPTMEEPKLDGRMVLTVAPLAIPRESLTLDCKGPLVQWVRIGESVCTFSQTKETLTINFAEPLAVGQPVDIEVSYTLDFRRNKSEGLTWSAGREDTNSLTLAFPQIHSQGQANENSRWFPCHDFPNERLTTEIIVDVESGYALCSNGHLVEKIENEGRTRWHWLQDKPHSTYLVTLVIGKFSIVEVGGPDSARPGLPMPVYVQQGSEDTALEVFANTPAMIAFFEQLFDEPYPWDQYAQLCVRDFKAGGMENTSATSLYAAAARGERGDQDDLISHELAHQWFGDLLTCRSWDHLWLNEGWATYAECLWSEHLGSSRSPEAASRAYQRAVMQSFRKQRNMNRAAAPQTPAVVTNRYTDPDDLFSRVDDVYSKGGVVLHMLRQRIGDAAFFAGVRKYIDDNKASGLVETSDFRRALEATSGQSLERFFDQWVMRPGMASLSVEYTYDEADNNLTIAVEQTQTIDRFNPAYAFTLPFLLKFADGTTQWVYLDTEARAASITVGVPSKPQQITIDPNITVFARSNVKQPLAMWMRDLLSPPTEFARIRAFEAINTQFNEALSQMNRTANNGAAK